MINRDEKIETIISQLNALRKLGFENQKVTLTNAGLTLGQGHLLQAIGSVKSLQAGDIADKMGITPGAITQVLDILESRQLICRSNDPEDRRKVKISLSGNGKKCLKLLKKAMHSDIKSLFSTLNDSDIRSLEEIVKKLINNREVV